MRFLKNKILKAQQALQRASLTTSSSSDIKQTIFIAEPKISLNDETSSETSKNSKPERCQRRIRMRQDNFQNEDAMKNIAVNYARAIASFAASSLAVPYLQVRLEKQNLSLEEFIDFITREKGKMGGICSFRARLLVEETDDEKIATCKRVFQSVAEVFIKYFSVNWIIHGRVSHKETYLKFRHKMLRRVQNPKLFTYIKERKCKQQKTSSDSLDR